jgi:hypothetical protein
MDPTTGLLLSLLAIIGSLSMRALVDILVELSPGGRRCLSVVTGAVALVGVGCLVVLLVAFQHDPHACPWNGCS